MPYSINPEQIRKTNNLLSQKKIILNKEGQKTDFSLNYLIDASFDEENGFSSSGEFKFAKFKGKREVETFSSRDFKLNGFVFNLDPLKENKKIGLAYQDEDYLESNLENGFINAELNERIDIGYRLAELNLLYDDYLYPNLKKVLFPDKSTEEVSQDDLFQALSSRNLTSEVGAFVKDLTSLYNDSSIRHNNELEQSEQNTGYDEYNHRYKVCSEDSYFREMVENKVKLFANTVNSYDLTHSNIRGDKSKSILDTVESLNHSVDLMSKELIYRSGLTINSSNSSLYKLQKKTAKRERAVCENILNTPIISDTTRKEILAYEQKILNGTISDVDRFSYNKLIGEIKLSFNERLGALRVAGLNLESVGFTEEESKVNRKYDNPNFQNISPFKDYLSKVQDSLQDVLNKQQNDISSEVILMQNRELERQIDRHVKQGPDGTILLDTEKLAVIEKIESLSSLTPEVQKVQIETLLEQDLPTLTNIVYKTESFCGLKDFYLNDVQESLRQELFGKHYHYLSADKFFEKIQEKLKEVDDISASQTEMKTLKNSVAESVVSRFKDDENMSTLITEAINSLSLSDLEKYIPNSRDNAVNEARINDFIDYLKNKNPDLDDSDKKTLDSNRFKSALSTSFMSGFKVYEDYNKTVLARTENKIKTEQVLDSLNANLTHKVHNLKVLEHQVSDVLGIPAENVLTDDKKSLDILKILEVRQSLYKDYYELDRARGKNEPVGLEQKEIAKKITFLEENLLNYKVNRKEDSLAVSAKDKLAYDTLINSANIKLGEVYKSNIAEINENNERIDQLETQIAIIERKPIGKFFTERKTEQKEKEIAELNSEIDKLRENNTKAQEQIESMQKEVIEKLTHISQDLRRTLDEGVAEAVQEVEVPQAVEKLEPALAELRATLVDIYSKSEDNSSKISNQHDNDLVSIRNLKDNNARVLETLDDKAPKELTDFIAKVNDYNNKLSESLDNNTEYSDREKDIKELLSVINSLKEDKEVSEYIDSSERERFETLFMVVEDEYENAVNRVHYTEPSAKDTRTHEEVQSDLESVDVKFMILATALKDNTFEDIRDKIISDEVGKSDYCLRLVRDKFSDLNPEDSEKLIGAIGHVFDKYEEMKSDGVSRTAFQLGVDKILKEDYALVPLDINGSNELYDILTSRQGQLNYTISVDDKELFEISADKSEFFESYLRDAKSFSQDEDGLYNEQLVDRVKAQFGIESDSLAEVKIDELKAEFDNILEKISESSVSEDVAKSISLQKNDPKGFTSINVRDEKVETISNEDVKYLKIYQNNPEAFKSNEDGSFDKKLVRDIKTTYGISDNEQIPAKMEELHEKFSKIFEEVEAINKESLSDRLTVTASLTDESLKALKTSVAAYGDDDRILIIPDGDNIKFSEPIKISIDASNGDYSFDESIIQKAVVSTVDLNDFVVDKINHEGLDSFEIDVDEDIVEDEIAPESNIKDVFQLSEVILDYDNIQDKDTCIRNINDFLQSESGQDSIEILTDKENIEDLLNIKNTDYDKYIDNLEAISKESDIHEMSLISEAIQELREQEKENFEIKLEALEEEIDDLILDARDDLSKKEVKEFMKKEKEILKNKDLETEEKISELEELKLDITESIEESKENTKQNDLDNDNDKDKNLDKDEVEASVNNEEENENDVDVEVETDKDKSEDDVGDRKNNYYANDL